MLSDQVKDVREEANKLINEFMQEIEAYSSRNFYKEDHKAEVHGRILELLCKICNK